MRKEEQKQARYWIRQRKNDPAFKSSKKELSEEKAEERAGEGLTPEGQRKKIEKIREAHSRIRNSWSGKKKKH